MERLIGTVSRGVRAPIIRSGDDIAAIVADSVLEAAASDDGFDVRDRDVLRVMMSRLHTRLSSPITSLLVQTSRIQ